MIRMIQINSASHAKAYYRSGLAQADYYIADQEVPGQFHGGIAKRLGLEGADVTSSLFDQLADNLDPRTGEALTPRTYDDRRVGYDINFHCPKSVSILHALGSGDGVLSAFQSAVDETMRDIERDVMTRVRTQGQYADRATGELLWTDFVHFTARPVAGEVPDPHLHAHCFVFNVTHDAVEGRMKAAQFGGIKRDMPYYQARFLKRLASKLAAQGFGLRKTAEAFEVTLVPQAAIEHFSKRSNHIGQVAKDKGITNPEELDQLGARTRAAKNSDLTMVELRTQWRSNLRAAGIGAGLTGEAATAAPEKTAEAAIDYALEHRFARNSVQRERQILPAAYLYSLDNPALKMDEIDRAFAADDRIFTVQEGQQNLCTTALVHAEERTMITLAREGLGALRPLDPTFSPTGLSNLGPAQQAAAAHLMHAPDRLTMIRGGAGTGKTTLLETIVPVIETTGRSVHMVAPLARAAEDLPGQRKGTVARLLKDPEWQNDLSGQIVWCDEAGMLGAQDMAALLKLAKDKQARLVLSGDPKQHSAVQRGDAMGHLQKIGKIPYVSVDTIYRQKSQDYRAAVEQIAQGNIEEGFARLDQMGAVREMEATAIPEQMVADFLAIEATGKSALAVSPTRTQMSAVNLAIREGLREAGKLGKREREAGHLVNLYWTEAQRGDHRHYRPGLVVQTHQHLPGIKRGSRLTVVEAAEGRVEVETIEGQKGILPLDRAKDFEVFQPSSLMLAKGDRLRLTRGGSDRQGKRLNNGWEVTVTGWTRSGAINVEKRSKGKTTSFQLEANHGHLDYGYCTTSHSAQGRTVDEVLIAQPAATFPATNARQFYVSVSRGRSGVTLYTDDKAALQGAVGKSGDRRGAMELVGQSSSIERGMDWVDIEPHLPEPDYEVDKRIEPKKEINYDGPTI